MMEISSIYPLSDPAILSMIGSFVRHHRLEQNKSQAELAHEAGINRSTLAEFEKGRKSTMDTFVRLIRVLNQLHVLDQFRVQQQISPIQLAEMQLSWRKRASKTKKEPLKKPKSDW